MSSSTSRSNWRTCCGWSGGHSRAPTAMAPSTSGCTGLPASFSFFHAHGWRAAALASLPMNAAALSHTQQRISGHSGRPGIRFLQLAKPLLGTADGQAGNHPFGRAGECCVCQQPASVFLTQFMPAAAQVLLADLCSPCAENLGLHNLKDADLGEILDALKDTISATKGPLPKP